MQLLRMCRMAPVPNHAFIDVGSDGEAPLLHLPLFTHPHPRRDPALDAEAVLHELTHGLSIRRVVGGVGLLQTQCAGMGEGWSDFYALALLSGGRRRRERQLRDGWV
jgi:hypothetical protein